MNIRIGAPVHAADGRVGRVERIILHPDTREVEGVVAAAGGGLLARDVIIPVERIEAADEEALRVNATVEEVGAMRAFAASQYTQPPDEWIPPAGGAASFYLFPMTPYAVGAFTPPAPQSMPPPREIEALDPGDVDVDRRTPVYCGSSEVGALERVVTEGDRLTHLVVHHQRGLEPRDVPVPVALVDRIGDEEIRLAISEEEFERLPIATD